MLLLSPGVISVKMLLPFRNTSFTYQSIRFLIFSRSPPAVKLLSSKRPPIMI